MARLIAPNGVEVDANESAVKALLDSGYRRAEADKPKRTTRKTTKPKE